MVACLAWLRDSSCLVFGSNFKIVKVDCNTIQTIPSLVSQHPPENYQRTKSLGHVF